MFIIALQVFYLIIVKLLFHLILKRRYSSSIQVSGLRTWLLLLFCCNVIIPLFLSCLFLYLNVIIPPQEPCKRYYSSIFDVLIPLFERDYSSTRDVQTTSECSYSSHCGVLIPPFERDYSSTQAMQMSLLPDSPTLLLPDQQTSLSPRLLLDWPTWSQLQSENRWM